MPKRVWLDDPKLPGYLQPGAACPACGSLKTTRQVFRAGPLEGRACDICGSCGQWRREGRLRRWVDGISLDAWMLAAECRKSLRRRKRRWIGRQHTHFSTHLNLLDPDH